MRYRKKQILIAVASVAVLALLIGVAVLLNEHRHPNQGEDYIPSGDRSTSEETTRENQEDDPVQDDTPIQDDTPVQDDTPEQDEEKDWSDPSKVTYSDFLEMTPDEQSAFQNSFPTPADYVSWFWDAWDAYEASKK